MTENKDYFFCGVGGSGMLPLAAIIKARGARVEGSDRALDQGRTNAKFDYLRGLGIALHPQDGSGFTRATQILVASAAVEDSVPDVAAAKKLGAARLSRAALLADLFNAARLPIGVAGTSGKSTTTAMIGWVLAQAGRDPTIMNGAVMKNFISDDAPFASARVGAGDSFVSEIDESDGSIAMFNPKIAVLNNIALDHKSMEELRSLFGGFVDRAQRAVLNLDNDETAAIAASRTRSSLTYSLEPSQGDLTAEAISPRPDGIAFTLIDRRSDASAAVSLKMPGRHNVSNALAAAGACLAAGLSIDDIAAGLNAFEGVKRRLEYIGEAGGVTVIDDFAHNPDKLTASLKTLHEFPGRLLVMFQPHGFGPLRTMKNQFISTFANHLCTDDLLIMPEPVYYGGTVERVVSSQDIAAGVRKRGKKAEAVKDRDACRDILLRAARPGDRIAIMGARDDTLTVFAEELLSALQ